MSIPPNPLWMQDLQAQVPFEGIEVTITVEQLVIRLNAGSGDEEVDCRARCVPFGSQEPVVFRGSESEAGTT